MEMHRVLRDGNYIKVGESFFVLSTLSAIVFQRLKDAGSKNPGYDAPPWFYSDSPYGFEILALGAEPTFAPDDFRAEYVPRGSEEHHPQFAKPKWPEVFNTEPRGNK